MSLPATLLAALLFPSGTDVERTVDAALPLANVGRVDVMHSGGHLVILPLPDPTFAARAELKLSVSGASTEEETRFLEHITLAVERRPDDVLFVETRFPSAESKPPAVSYVARLWLWLPAELAVSVDSRYGRVEVSGRQAGVTVRNRLGSVTVRDNTGPVSIGNEYDQVLVENVSGDVDVVNSDEVTIRDVRGSVEVLNKYGPVGVHGVTGGVTIENRNAPLDLTRLGGPTKLTAPHCAITLFDAGDSVTVHASNGDLEIRKVRGDVTIDHRHGTLSLTDLVGRLVVRGSFIPLSARQIQGEVEILTQASSILLADVVGSARVESSTGSIEILNPRGPLTAIGQGGLLRVSLDRIENGHPIHLENRSSPMELVLPRTGSFRLEARSTLGVLDSEIPDLIVEQSGRVKTGRWVVGEGASQVTALGVDGAIRLRLHPAPDDH